MMNNHFITIDELKKKLKFGQKLFVFGISEKSKVHLDNFSDQGLKVSFIVDNDSKRQGTSINGIKILAPEELIRYPDAIIIVACSFFAEISSQLEKLGICEVYELTDINLAATADLISADCVIKEKFNQNPSEKVFLYVADGFGDNIIKYPILERLSKSDEADNYYIVVDRQANYDIYSSLFNHVMLYDKDKMQVDIEYRKKIMEKIDEKHFRKKMCFCPSAFYHTHFDPFHISNTNISTSLSYFECLNWKNGKLSEPISDDMKKMAEYFFGWADFDLTQKGSFSKVLKNIKRPIEIEGKYVVFGMGGISWHHVYSVKKMSKIADWFIDRKYKVLLLGYGKEDEKYNKRLCRLCSDESSVINATSLLTAYESLKMLEGAELFIGLDSALAHGVYTMDKKGIVLMSGNNFSSRFVHKNDNKMIYLSYELDCKGCEQCIYGEWNNQKRKRGLCIQKIAEESITEAAERLLVMK